MASKESTVAIVPLSIQTPADVSRLLQELETIENSFIKEKAVSAKEKVAVSASLQAVVKQNKLSVAKVSDRNGLKELLVRWHDHAPRLHISFSTEPNPTFLEKLLFWLRQEINPEIFITIGLQPAIGAGCTIRTTNKYFDLSLRQTFIAKRKLLLDQLAPQAVPEGPAT
jgi:F0F1-type ATP synthase delta subunit